MIYHTGTHYVCADCLVWLANADASGLDYLYPETAAARLAAIQEGERITVEEYGQIHIGESDDDEETHLAPCDCCHVISAPRHAVTTWIDPIGQPAREWPYNQVPYLDKRFIVEAWRDDKYKGIDFYGSSKAPTSIMVKCADNRTRRVWAIAEGNAGSAYLIVAGERLFIDLETGDHITSMANHGDSAWLRNGGQV